MDEQRRRRATRVCVLPLVVVSRCAVESERGATAGRDPYPAGMSDKLLILRGEANSRRGCVSAPQSSAEIGRISRSRRCGEAQGAVGQLLRASTRTYYRW